jgi:hypothetical protein
MDCRRASTALLAGCLFLAASSPTLAAEPPSPDALPRYDDPILIQAPVDPPEEPKNPPLRAVPHDGRGSLAAGGIVTLVGGATFVGGIVFGTNGDYGVLEVPPWIPLVVVGAAGTTTGMVLLGLGASKHRRYRQWEAQQTDAIPPQGYGLIGSGVALMGVGLFGIVFSGLIWSDQSPFPIYPERIPPAKAGVGLGVTALGVGTALLATGAVRNQRFGAWRKTQTVQLSPTLVPTRFGLHIGLAGRF